MQEADNPPSVNQQEPDYLKLVGLAAVHHSHLDYCIRKVIYRLAEVQSVVGEKITHYQTTKALLGTLKRLVDARVPNPSLKKAFLVFITDARRANDLRNDVVHGLWASDELGRGIRIGKMRTISPLNLEQLPDMELSDLKKLIRHFERLIDESMRLLDQLQ